MSSEASTINQRMRPPRGASVTFHVPRLARAGALLAIVLALPTIVTYAQPPSEMQRDLSADVPALLSQATRTVNQLSPAEVSRRIESLIAEKGPSAELYSQLGFARYRNHQPDKSLDAFTAMLKFRQPNADELRIIALDYVDLRDLSSADKWLHAAIKLSPGDWRGWRYLGGVEFSEELMDDAAKSFRECLKLDPQNALAEDGLARSLEAQGKLDEAARHFQLAEQINRRDAAPSSLPLLHYGEFLFRQNKFKEALLKLAASSQLAPNDAETHEYLSKVYEELGDRNTAIAEMQKASILRPDSPRLHLLLGNLYRSTGNRAAAIKEIEQYEQLSREHKEDWDR